MRCYSFLTIISLFIFCNNSVSQVFQIDTTIKSTELIENYLVQKNHNGIIINNIEYKGFSYTKALFYYRSKYQALPPYGIVLSTGNVMDVLGPNNESASTENHLKGDKDLSQLYHNSKTFDAVIFDFDFISLTDSIGFVFQFASEEYPEYVNRGVSDIFGFFVTNTVSNEKTNLSIIKENGSPITIDLINSETNNSYYISNNHYELHKLDIDENDLFYFENSNLFQFDGFTKPIHTGMKLEPFTKYHFKIAISDVGDRKFDSWVFIQGNSLISKGKKAELSDKDVRNYIEFVKLDSITCNSDVAGNSIFVPIFFDYNSYELTSDSKINLDKIFNLLSFSTNQIVINGFTDESGSTEHNLTLSEQRANEVKQYFINKGIDQIRIESFGLGEIKSGKRNVTSRKVEIKLLKKGS